MYVSLGFEIHGHCMCPLVVLRSMANVSVPWFCNSWLLSVPFSFTSIATVCVIWFYNSWIL